MAVLGLGLAALGRPGYSTLGHAGDFPSTAPTDMERQAHAVLDCAYANGIRHVDTARSYGRGEAFLRSWLEKRQPKDVFVSSKWGYRYTADWQRTADVHEVKDHSLEHFEQQWAESKAILGPWLKLYQIHSATYESEVLGDPDVLLRLFRLRKETGVKIGATVTGVKQPELLHSIYMLIGGDEEDQIFDWVQATWNVLT
ncbi:MAG TPA: aldo/keto reductase [Archangium sp.]